MGRSLPAPAPLHVDSCGSDRHPRLPARLEASARGPAAGSAPAGSPQAAWRSGVGGGLGRVSCEPLQSCLSSSTIRRILVWLPLPPYSPGLFRIILSSTAPEQQHPPPSTHFILRHSHFIQVHSVHQRHTQIAAAARLLFRTLLRVLGVTTAGCHC